MNHSMNQSSHDSNNVYSVKNFLPLIVLSGIIISFTLIKQLLYGFDMNSAMYDFMGSFLLIFSSFKIFNLYGFAEAYSTYDIIARRYLPYAYVYPFIEFALGILYLARI